MQAPTELLEDVEQDLFFFVCEGDVAKAFCDAEKPHTTPVVTAVSCGIGEGSGGGWGGHWTEV